jgi:hypothetical protein
MPEGVAVVIHDDDKMKLCREETGDAVDVPETTSR